jgi:hypothetical protein
VAAPDDLCPPGNENRHKSGGLGIVHDDDVVRANLAEDRLGVRSERRFVVAALGLVESATVARRSVEPVVNPLRRREELRIAANDQPLRLDAGPPRIAQQDVKELGHATACGRGVDVDDSAVGEALARPSGDVEESRDPVRSDDRGETLRVERLKPDVQPAPPNTLLADLAQRAHHDLRDDVALRVCVVLDVLPLACGQLAL